MKTIIIDLDDVITTGNFDRLIEDYMGRKILPEEIKGYYKQEVLGDKRDDFFDNYFFEHDVYENAKLIDGSYDVIKKLNDKYKVYICSDFNIVDRPKRSGIHLKNKFNFLVRNFDFLTVDQFIFSCNKDLIHADIKIDDKIKHLTNGDMRILFSAYHNVNISDEELAKNGIIRAGCWQDIEHLLLDER